MFTPGSRGCGYKTASGLGKWPNRDPIEEPGGDNLYEFAVNSPIDSIDDYGLDTLSYSSDAAFYFNGRPFSYTSSGNSSGHQNSSTAWFWQTGIENTCNGGLCNSAGTGLSSSYVTATVKNTTKCTVWVNCSCNVGWSGATYTLGRTGGFLAKGTVLDASFYAHYMPKMNSRGISTSVGSGSMPNTLIFALDGGMSKQLYYGIISVSIPHDTPGTGFTASMNGSCSCSLF